MRLFAWKLENFPISVLFVNIKESILILIRYRRKHVFSIHSLINMYFSVYLVSIEDNIKHTKDIPRLEKTINHMNQNLKTRSQIASEISSLTGILLFVSSFLGVAFLIATGCIIYIKQIDETEDELENYSILRKLGFTQKDMDRGLKLKVAFNFGLPLAIALLHAYFAALVFMKFTAKFTLM